MYIMGALLRHGSVDQKNKYLPKIASGELTDFTQMEQKESWIALFTYNPVEGVYFDNNPTGYLGGY